MISQILKCLTVLVNPSQPQKRSRWLGGVLDPRVDPEGLGVLFVVEVRQPRSFSGGNGTGWGWGRDGWARGRVGQCLALGGYLSPCLATCNGEPWAGGTRQCR